MKKLLILGGKPIGTDEIIKCAKKMNVHTVVTDYLSVDDSPGKQLADEVWNISTAEIDTLQKKVERENIDGIFTGVNEFNIQRMIEL